MGRKHLKMGPIQWGLNHCKPSEQKYFSWCVLCSRQWDTGTAVCVTGVTSRWATSLNFVTVKHTHRMKFILQRSIQSRIYSFSLNLEANCLSSNYKWTLTAQTKHLLVLGWFTLCSRMSHKHLTTSSTRQECTFQWVGYLLHSSLGGCVWRLRVFQKLKDLLESLFIRLPLHPTQREKSLSSFPTWSLSCTFYGIPCSQHTQFILHYIFIHLVYPKWRVDRVEG